MRTRWTVPYASCRANARSRASSPSLALRSARSAYASSSNTRRTTSKAALRAAVGDDDRLETHVTPFEDAALPACDLVNASYSLPFCARFDELWERIGAALRPGGRFSGQLFGDRDGWAPDPGITFLTRTEVEELLGAYDVERLDEVEEDSKTALGNPKHWHLFHIVVRRR